MGHNKMRTRRAWAATRASVLHQCAERSREWVWISFISEVCAQRGTAWGSAAPGQPPVQACSSEVCTLLTNLICTGGIFNMHIECVQCCLITLCVCMRLIMQ